MAKEIRVAVYPNEAIARLWAGVLEDQGIRSMVRPEAGGLNLTYHGAFIPHALFVLDGDSERALGLLDETGETPEPHEGHT